MQLVALSVTLNEEVSRLERIKKFFENDRFAMGIGIEILEVSLGQAKAKLEVKDCHLNGVNTVQGGAIFTLADFTFAMAANSYGTVAMAINVNISYMKAISSGTLFAEAREVAVNPKLGTYTVDITNEQGDLIAVFQGMAYRKQDKL